MHYRIRLKPYSLAMAESVNERIVSADPSIDFMIGWSVQEMMAWAHGKKIKVAVSFDKTEWTNLFESEELPTLEELNEVRVEDRSLCERGLIAADGSVQPDDSRGADAVDQSHLLPIDPVSE